MAINYRDVQQLRLQSIGNVTDTYANALKKVADQLERRTLVLLGQKKQNVGDLGDVALARAQAQKLLADSGYYRVTGDLLSTGYQKVLNENLGLYNRYYGAGLGFEDVPRARLEAIRQMSSQVFQDYGGQYATDLQRVMVEYNFGTTSIKQASEQLASTLDAGMRRYAETIVNTQVTRFERESANEMATAAGIEKYIYVGPSDKKTRPFCEKHIEVVKTMDEWSKLIAPDSPGPVPEWGGGYNCRHSIVPYVEE